jgi:shikimate kinase
MTRRHLVLVGLMGSGKSTIGRACARATGLEFVDTDEVIAATAAMPIPEIFATEGESGFRARERVVVADLAHSPQPHVIACGGGVALDPDNRAVLRANGVVVWLDASPEVLAARVGSGVGRPLLADGDPLTTLRRLGTLRAPAYEAAAHVRVDASGESAAVTNAVLEAMAREQDRGD